MIPALLTFWRFLKPLAPYILAVVAIAAAYGIIYAKGYNEGKDAGYANSLEETAKIIKAHKCGDCKCPTPKPCGNIDFDKMKSRAITIQNHQHITYGGDSLLLPRIREVVKEVIEDVPVVRCKR